MPGLPFPLRGIIPPVCTPLNEDYSVDAASLARLLRFMLAGGVHGVFMLGSSSESLFLTDDQRDVVMETAVETVAGQVPVLAGVFDVTTSLAIEHARAARRAGVDGLVLTAPFYATFSQEEIVGHFRAVRDAVDLPILAYDIPSTVHVKLTRDTVARLAHEGLIAGIKDSSGDDANFRGVILATRDLPDFATFTGSELVVDAALLFGASGSVPGLANVDPAGYVRLYDAARAGDWETARREQERLYQLFSIVYSGTPGRVGPTASALGAFKTALMLRGVIATNVMGRPLTRLNEAEVERVRRALEL
ncbi:MAG: dihydrodipicolinate synthase family protein [Chloroflexota bacterium]